MKPERLARRWQRRHRKLVGALQVGVRVALAHGDVEAVHQLRVTLRRLRLSVRLAKGVFDPEVICQFRTWAARISQATSPVRDLDIAVDWLKASRAGPALVQEGEQRRSAAWRRRKRLVRALSPRVRLALGRIGKPRRAAAVIDKRFPRLESRYRDHIRQALPAFFALLDEDRHEFRRMVRWWRYLRELALPKRKSGKDPQLLRLLAVQETLGEMQNLSLVESAFRTLTPSTELGELQALLARQQAAQVEAARRALAGLKPFLK